MNRPSSDRRGAALASLYRVRAAESQPDEAGIRQVWHQGTRGADLLSWVDERGRVNRQELTLLGDFFVWTSTDGLRTGRVREGDHARSTLKGSDLVSLDLELSPERVLPAAHALGQYDGDDRYLQHVKRLLALSANGLEHREEVTVTRAAAAAPTKEAGSTTAPNARVRTFALVGAFAVLAAGVAVLLLGK